MGRSLGFGSTARDSIAQFKTRFRYGSAPEALSLATYGNSPAHYAKGTRSAERTRMPAISLPQLVGAWFQVLLTPLEGVLFTFQSPYLCAIGRAGVLSLRGWTPYVQSRFHEPRPTRPPLLGCCLPDCHLLWSTFPDRSAVLTTTYGSKPWADPLSLAATYGVSVDVLSSGYLDVSVPRVRPERPMHSAAGDAIWLPSDAGLPHSEISGSTRV